MDNTNSANSSESSENYSSTEEAQDEGQDVLVSDSNYQILDEKHFCDDSSTEEDQDEGQDVFVIGLYR